MAVPLAQGKLPRLPQPGPTHRAPPPPPPRPPSFPSAAPYCLAVPLLGSLPQRRLSPPQHAQFRKRPPPSSAPSPRGGPPSLSGGMSTTGEGVGIGVVSCRGPQPGRASPHDSHSVRWAYSGRYRHTIEVRRPVPTVHHLIHVPRFPPLPLFFCSFLFFFLFSFLSPFLSFFFFALFFLSLSDTLSFLFSSLCSSLLLGIWGFGVQTAVFARLQNCKLLLCIEMGKNVLPHL